MLSNASRVPLSMRLAWMLTIHLTWLHESNLSIRAAVLVILINSVRNHIFTARPLIPLNSSVLQ